MERHDVLESWKEISAFLKRNVRTCQAWEKKLGLPVHRLDDSPKARVFAYPDELQQWLEKRLHEKKIPGTITGSSAKPFFMAGLVLVALLTAILLIKGFRGAKPADPSPGRPGAGIPFTVPPPDKKENPPLRTRIDPDAYTLYLQGNEQLNNTFDFDKALDCFQRATFIDPDFADAYVGMAFSLINLRLSNAGVGGPPPQEVFPRARAAAAKAIAFDKTSAKAHAALAEIELWFDWDWKAAERDYKHALDLSPRDKDILLCYSAGLMTMGRFDEGIALRRKALDLDPLSALISVTLGGAYCRASRFDEAIEHLLKIRDMYPSVQTSVDYQLAWNYAGKGMFQKAVEISPDPISRAYFHARAGQRDQALKILGRLLERSKRMYVEPTFLAMIYGGLGDMDEAFDWLTTGLEKHAPYMLAVMYGWEYDPLRSDPRFAELTKKMGLSPSPSD